jgi:hypothetical protein
MATQTPTIVLTGPILTATRLDAPPEATWVEAWQFRTRHDAPAAAARIIGDSHRVYLVRIEQQPNVQALAVITIDDRMVRDAVAAGLPAQLGHDARLICVCPADVTAGQARWVLRMLARKAVRNLPVPIRTLDDRAAWVDVVDVLVDVLAVNRVLTETLG